MGERVSYGFWRSPEFEDLFEQYHAGKMTLEEIAKRAGTNTVAALHAYYRWRKRMFPHQTFERGHRRRRDPTERLIQFALDVLGDKIAERVQELEKENVALKEENASLRRKCLDLEARLRAAEKANSGLERQIAAVLHRRGLVGTPPAD